MDEYSAPGILDGVWKIKDGLLKNSGDQPKPIRNVTWDLSKDG